MSSRRPIEQQMTAAGSPELVSFRAHLADILAPEESGETENAKVGMCEISADELIFEIPEQPYTIRIPLSEAERECLLKFEAVTSSEPEQWVQSSDNIPDGVLVLLLEKLDDYGLAGLVYRRTINEPWRICVSEEELKSVNQKQRDFVLYEPKRTDVEHPLLEQVITRPQTRTRRQRTKRLTSRLSAESRQSMTSGEIYEKQMMSHTVLNNATQISLVTIVTESLIKLNLATFDTDKIDPKQLAAKILEDPTVGQDDATWTVSDKYLGLVAELSPDAQKAIEILVNHYIRYIYHRINHPSYHGYHINLMLRQGRLYELINAGAEGLRRAIIGFDLKRDKKLSTYATWWIDQYISRTAINESTVVRIPVHMADKISVLRRLQRRLHQELGVEPLPEDIALAYLPSKIGLTAIDPELLILLEQDLEEGEEETDEQEVEEIAEVVDGLAQTPPASEVPSAPEDTAEEEKEPEIDPNRTFTWEDVETIREWVLSGQQGELEPFLLHFWTKTLDHVNQLLAYADLSRMASLQELVSPKRGASSMDEGSELIHFLPDPDALPVDSELISAELREALEAALNQWAEEHPKGKGGRSTNPHRDVMIVKMLFGLRPMDEKPTLDSVGRKFGLTRERIRQIRDEILASLADNPHIRHHLIKLLDQIDTSE